MNKILKPIVIIALGVFLIGLIGSTITTIATGSFNILNFNTVEITESAQYNGHEISELEVNTSTVDVILIPAKTDQIDILLSGEVTKNFAEHYKLDTSVYGDKLKISVKQKGKLVFVGVNISRVKLQVTIPEKMYEQIKISSSTGDLEVERVLADKLALSTNTGDILLKSFEGKQLQVDTQTGDSHLHDVIAKMSIKSSTGDIEVKNSRGTIDARSSTGDIEIWMKEITEDMEIYTSTGDVQINVEQAPTAISLDFSASTGRTTANLHNILYESKEKKNLRGRVGEGGPTVYVRSSTGDIDLSLR